MLRNRNLRKSIREHFETLLTDASDFGLQNDYNVYNEESLRTGASVTFPYVFLVDAAIRPTQTTLPFIVLEVSRIEQTQFELGNRDGRHLQCYLHIFGKNRGERDDLASMFQDNIGQAIVVKDYSSGVGVADGTVIEIEPGVEQFDAPPKAEELVAEASLLNMTIVSFRGFCKV